MEIEVYKGQDIADILGTMGLDVVFDRLEISPSSLLYHFTLENPLDFSKLHKIAPCLSAVIHKKINIKDSSTSSFCFSIAREQREYPTFFNNHGALQNKPAGEIMFGIGEQGQAITRNIRDTKSILIGGSSGGGKSVFLNQMICSLLCYSKPEECGIVLIDLKRVEFELYKNAPHLIAPVQFEFEGAINVLKDVRTEIQRRYKEMQKDGIRKATTDKYPIIAIFIDEYAELSSRGNKKTLDELVSSIASTGRACNVFIVIATQHAVSTIISNVIKSNLQSRVGLRTTNIAQSNCILGTKDCVNLLGYGDSYLSFDGVAGLQRVQSCFIDENNIKPIMEPFNAAKQASKQLKRQNKVIAWIKRLWSKIQRLPIVRPRGLYVNYTMQELNDYDCFE